MTTADSPEPARSPEELVRRLFQFPTTYTGSPGSQGALVNELSEATIRMIAADLQANQNPREQAGIGRYRVGVRQAWGVNVTIGMPESFATGAPTFPENMRKFELKRPAVSSLVSEIAAMYLHPDTRRTMLANLGAALSPHSGGLLKAAAIRKGMAVPLGHGMAPAGEDRDGGSLDVMRKLVPLAAAAEMSDDDLLALNDALPLGLGDKGLHAVVERTETLYVHESNRRLVGALARMAEGGHELNADLHEPLKEAVTERRREMASRTRGSAERP